MTPAHRSRNLMIKIAAIVLGIGSIVTFAPTSAQAADLTPAQIDAGLKRFQTTSARASYFMSMEVAPEVTGAVPLKAGMHRLWDMKTAWKDVNPAQNVFDWSVLDQRVAQAEATGAQPMLVLGLTPEWAASDRNAGDPRWGLGTASPPLNIENWKTYVQAVVNRYGSRIAAYEVWNEANLQTFWTGSYDKLAELTKTAYDIIKSKNSNALVLMASTTTRLAVPAARFTTGYLGALGAVGNPFDGYTIHTYPAGDIPFAGISAQRILDIKAWQTAVVKAVGPDSALLDRLIFDTEVNYGLAGPATRPSTDFSDDQGATLLEQTYRDSAALGIDATFWYLYTATPFDLLGVQMWSGSPVTNAKWAELRAGSPAVPSAVTSPASSSGIEYRAPTKPWNFKVRQIGGAAVLTWEAPSSLRWMMPIDDAVDGYEIQMPLAAGADEGPSVEVTMPWNFKVREVADNTFKYVSQLPMESGLTYFYRLRAFNAIGRSSWTGPIALVYSDLLVPPTRVNAWGSASKMLVFWEGSSLPTDELLGYEISAETSQQEPVVVRTIGIKTAARFTPSELGARRGTGLWGLPYLPNDWVRFKVRTIDIHGNKSRASSWSPARQFTDALPAPDAFAATYERTSDVLIMKWKKPDAFGTYNVLGYELEYIWPGDSTWTHFDVIVGRTQAAYPYQATYSLEKFLAARMTVRIRSIGWPGQEYSAWTPSITITKRFRL